MESSTASDVLEDNLSKKGVDVHAGGEELERGSSTGSDRPRRSATRPYEAAMACSVLSSFLPRPLLCILSVHDSGKAIASTSVPKEAERYFRCKVASCRRLCVRETQVQVQNLLALFVPLAVFAVKNEF